MLEDALSQAGIVLTAVVLIEAADGDIVDRMAGRVSCARGHVFHVRTAPPARPEVCDHDGELLQRSDDDRPETVRHRLAVYDEATAPLVGSYRTRGLLRRVDGTRRPRRGLRGHPDRAGGAKTALG